MAAPAMSSSTPTRRIGMRLATSSPWSRASRFISEAKAPGAMALLSTVPDREMPYGRLVRDGNGVLERIVEHVDATPEQRAIRDTNAGFYAIRLGHLRRDLAALRADNAKGELYLTDLVAHAYQRGGAIAIPAPFTEVAGINDRVDLATIEAEARRVMEAAREATAVLTRAGLIPDAR